MNPQTGKNFSMGISPNTCRVVNGRELWTNAIGKAAGAEEVVEVQGCRAAAAAREEADVEKEGRDGDAGLGGPGVSETRSSTWQRSGLLQSPPRDGDAGLGGPGVSETRGPTWQRFDKRTNPRTDAGRRWKANCIWTARSGCMRAI